MTENVFKDSNQMWRWNVEANNHKLIASAGEGFHNKRDCENSLNLVEKHFVAKHNAAPSLLKAILGIQ